MILESLTNREQVVAWFLLDAVSPVLLMRNGNLQKGKQHSGSPTRSDLRAEVSTFLIIQLKSVFFVKFLHAACTVTSIRKLPLLCIALH